MLGHRYREIAPFLRAILLVLRIPTECSAVVARERSMFITQRVQVTARLLCALTLGWLLIDLLTISWPLAGALSVIRIATALMFGLLARHRPLNTAPGASRAVGMLIGIAVVFCLVTNIAFWCFQSGESLFAISTYLYTPFMIATGLSFFPLVAAECVLLSIPILATMAASAVLWSQFTDAISIEATLWRLGVVCAIASFSAMSQLQFLSKLTEQSAHDSLTGVLNRKSGKVLLSAQFALAVRNNRPLSVLFVDLDFFKSVNDNFGHPAGDGILRQMAGVLQSTLRRQDIVIRWGGEEFVVILPETDCAGARTVLHNLNQKGFGLRPDGTPQTASIGLSERMQDEASDWSALIELADARMYEAKRAGRNRFVGPKISRASSTSEPAPPLIDRGRRIVWKPA